MSEPIYEWKAMSEWLAENPPDENKAQNKLPWDDGWDIIGGALRRKIRKLGIFIQSRLHEADMTGEIDLTGAKLEHLNIPMEFDIRKEGKA